MLLFGAVDCNAMLALHIGLMLTLQLQEDEGVHW